MIGVQGKGVVSMGLPRMRGLKVHHVSSLLHLRNVSMGLPRMRGLKVSQYLGFDDHIIRVSMGLPRMRGLKVYLQCRSIHGNASFRWVDCKEATPSKASREKSLSIQLLKFLWWPIIKR